MRGYTTGKSTVISKSSFVPMQISCDIPHQQSIGALPAKKAQSTAHSKGWPDRHDASNLGVQDILKDVLYPLSSRWEMVAKWFSQIQTQSHMRWGWGGDGHSIGWARGWGSWAWQLEHIFSNKLERKTPKGHLLGWKYKIQIWEGEYLLWGRVIL